jgi:hypothetical protein
MYTRKAHETREAADNRYVRPTATAPHLDSTKTGHPGTSHLRLLHLNKRTSNGGAGKAVQGQLLTHAVQQTTGNSLDHIVSNQQEFATNRQPQFPRSLQIDDYLECGGLLHGQLPRLRPL